MFVVLRLVTLRNVIRVESDNWMVDEPPLTVALDMAVAAAVLPYPASQTLSLGLKSVMTSAPPEAPFMNEKLSLPAPPVSVLEPVPDQNTSLPAPPSRLALPEPPARLLLEVERAEESVSFPA